MLVLVINAGSSSIKYQLFRMPETEILAKGYVERIGEEGSKFCYVSNGRSRDLDVDAGTHEKAMEIILQGLSEGDDSVVDDISQIEAVGHRVVHGGEEFTDSVIINDKVIDSIEKFADLAPLHNPPNLTGIRVAIEKLPSAKQVACFDTAFHTTIPQVAYMYALPYDFYEKYRIRRYGFHGISHRYVSRRAAQLLGRGAYDVNLITCHLGNGCSITAIKDGRSVDTSMGLTPLEGVVMGTRTGDLDPAILFYLAGKGYDMQELKSICNKESGLLGISGESNDMRNLTELAAGGNIRARLAVDIFCYRIKKYIGAYSAALESVDAVIFTGGIGENAVGIRTDVCVNLENIGIEIDESKNSSYSGQDLEISSDKSMVKIFIIPTNEEASIAADTYELSK